MKFYLKTKKGENKKGKRKCATDPGAWSLLRPRLKGPAGRSECSPWMKMCKNSLWKARGKPLSTSRWLSALKQNQENRWTPTTFRKNTKTSLLKRWTIGHIKAISSFISPNTQKKKFRAPPFAIHRFTHNPHRLNFKQFDWTRIRSTWDENPSLEREFIKEITSHINNRNYLTICNCPFHIFREPFGVFMG